MTMTAWLRASIVAPLVALPLLSGCTDPPITGPGGGPSTGAAGSTNATGFVTPGNGNSSEVSSMR